jgi:large subunit ribosomal protein L24
MTTISNFKTGDRLFVLSGTHKKKVGVLKRFFKNGQKVLVEGVNIKIKHQKANPDRNMTGGRITMEKPIDASNVALICPKCSEATWIRYEIIPATDELPKRKYRICRRCRARIDE